MKEQVENEINVQIMQHDKEHIDADEVNNLENEEESNSECFEFVDATQPQLSEGQLIEGQEQVQDDIDNVEVTEPINNVDLEIQAM